MIDSLFKPVSESFNEGKLLLDFYFSYGERKPWQIGIFRYWRTDQKPRWNPSFHLLPTNKNNLQQQH
ncbi:hypothetical protein ACHQM5_012246 [Ranunculus cassubicifolius]